MAHRMCVHTNDHTCTWMKYDGNSFRTLLNPDSWCSINISKQNINQLQWIWHWPECIKLSNNEIERRLLRRKARRSVCLAELQNKGYPNRPLIYVWQLLRMICRRRCNVSCWKNYFLCVFIFCLTKCFKAVRIQWSV